MKVVSKPAVKRSASSAFNSNGNSTSKIRRIQPTKIGEIGIQRSSEIADPPISEAGTSSVDLTPQSNANHEEDHAEIKTEEEEPVAGPSNAKPGNENERTPQLEKLILACRAADGTNEMKRVIKQKLLKYYHSVHPDYVTSKNFRKTILTTIEEIEKEPHLVYMKLKLIIEELDARRKCKAVVFTQDSVEVKGTGDETKDVHLKKLYKALVKVKRHIADLEEAEVDWDDDDNSSYLKKVRFEKRACDIYEKVKKLETFETHSETKLFYFKICEITGESTHAHRIVKKPIKFKGSEFPEFNKKLTKIVNQNNSFPNYLSVLKCLDYCNKKHQFGLMQEQMKRIAQDAFEKLGKKLQERRKMDFYETAQFYVGKNKDPAKEDPELRSQLEKNKKFYAKYDEIINE